ncbi:MAG: Pr6Pr family membrane protein [Clostridia bacterium]|nr:Pr6Pr family membrane protein [Clostridia bacterium]
MARKRTATEGMSRFESKSAGVWLLAAGVFGILLLGHLVASYENLLRPRLAELIESRIITNDRDGPTFLWYFTNQSNFIADLYLILFAAGSFGNSKLRSLTRNALVRAAVTVPIIATGLVYCTMLLPFARAPFPFERGIWFSNFVNIWSHMLLPLLFAVLWFVPMTAERLKPVKTALTAMIYPLCYLAVSAVRGAVDGFYPYPFLNSRKLWEVFFGEKPYSAAIAVPLFVCGLLVLTALFFGIGCALAAIRVRRLLKAEKD